MDRRTFLTAAALLVPQIAYCGSLTLDDIAGIRGIGLSTGFDAELLEQEIAQQVWYLSQLGEIPRVIPYPDSKAQLMLEQIAKPLWQTSTRRSLAWRIALTTAEAVNACTYGGGVIFINVGLVRACNSQTELASVIAHEIGHVEHRHAIRRFLSDAILNQYGIKVDLQKIQAHRGRGVKPLDNILNAANEVMFSSFKRLWEHEADAFTLRAFLQTGYPLNRASDFLQILAERFGNHSQHTCLYDTHPTTMERIKRLDSLAATYNSNPRYPDSDAFRYLKTL